MMLGFRPGAWHTSRFILRSDVVNQCKKGTSSEHPAGMPGCFSYRELTINLDSFLKCDIKINFQMDPRLNVR